MSGNGLTPFAWIFMLTSMISVTVLVVWCFFRIDAYRRILFDRPGFDDYFVLERRD